MRRDGLQLMLSRRDVVLAVVCLVVAVAVVVLLVAVSGIVTSSTASSGR